MADKRLYPEKHLDDVPHDVWMAWIASGDLQGHIDRWLKEDNDKEDRGKT